MDDEEDERKGRGIEIVQRGTRRGATPMKAPPAAIMRAWNCSTGLLLERRVKTRDVTCPAMLR